MAGKGSHWCCLCRLERSGCFGVSCLPSDPSLHWNSAGHFSRSRSSSRFQETWLPLSASCACKGSQEPQWYQQQQQKWRWVLVMMQLSPHLHLHFSQLEPNYNPPDILRGMLQKIQNKVRNKAGPGAPFHVFLNIAPTSASCAWVFFHSFAMTGINCYFLISSID